MAGVVGEGVITEELYLSGTGSDDGVDWEFSCRGGRSSGVWTTIPVPSCWELEGFGTYNYGHDSNPASEHGLYRHTFVVPADWSGKRVDLVFEGVMTDAEVRVNGVLAGPLHQGGFRQFRYEISGLLNFGSDNLLEVTVWKRSANSSVNAAEREADYWIFGGIYRPVRLELRPAESIQRVALNPAADGTLTGDLFLNNIGDAAQLDVRVQSTDGIWSYDLAPVTVPAGAAEVSFSESVAGIATWNMEDPVLYDVVVTLSRGGQSLHMETVRTGFRTIEIRPQDGIYLNGVKIRLKGVSYHTFWPDSGRTVNRSLSEDVVARIKSMNMNTVRATSYPADKHFLETCDAEGLLVFAELPGWQDPYDDATAARMVRELVERDVNHPSIIFWNNGNEGGWNPTVEDDYALYDPQARPVVHPGANHNAGGVKVSGPVVFNGLETTHYPTWTTLQTRLSAADLYLPTEVLHGLYDGGHGAGLADYWGAVRNSPVGAGMILWVLADEGVVRTDLGGSIDTDGNHAPDGIVGPYGEPEPSFNAIREIWSPVVVTTDPVLDASFDGSIALLNDYHFTSLDTIRFDWALVDFPRLNESGETGDLIRQSGSLIGPSIAPQSTGDLILPLQTGWQDHDALRLEAFDANGNSIRSWTWRIRSRTEVLEANLPAGTAEPVSITDGGTDWVLSSGGVGVRVGKTSGRISELRSGGVLSGLTNGPRLVAGTASLSSISTSMEGSGGVIEAAFTGNLTSLTYRMYPGGVLEINYRMNLSGSYANVGLTFDQDTSLVSGLRWLGGGPQPVWKNRTAGAELGVWEKARNSAVPGEEWTFDPVFRGHHADLHWATVQSTGAALHFLTDTAGLFFRILTPSPGSDPRDATFVMPAGDISLLHGISGVGNKFMSAQQTGPAGQLNTVTGTLAGRFHLVAGEVDPRPQVVSAEYVSPYRVRIRYDRAMDPGAADPSAYAIMPARVVHAVIAESADTFLLDIEPLVAGTSYTLAIDPLQATSGAEQLREPYDFVIAAPPEPLFYFPFDEAAAGVSPNAGTAGGSASLNGGATLSGAYRHTGLESTGSPDGASFTAPSLTRFTASAWVKLDQEVAGTFPRIVSFGSDNVQWAFDISSANYPRSIAFNAAGLGDWRLDSNVLPPSATWMHLAVSFDSASGLDPVLYLNGEPLAVIRKGNASGSYNPSGLSGIGNRTTDWARVLLGWIDELRIENRILSHAEIAALAAVPPTETFAAFIANWPELDPDPLEDPDKDGILSLFEHLTGTDPSVPNPHPRVIEFDGSSLKVVFPISVTATGTELYLEENDSLNSTGWAKVPFSEFEPVRHHDGVIEWRRNWILSGETRRFFRLATRPDS
ncbi:MAG TPA: glycoside hydrolase family 2 TIM barrel-domain containing protein [Oceanipulchritudo sp.]|nr:glycoside hydrolase family 2 TIM barrel-domain containing protein [Oceanipulchritudo sp.]